MEELKLEIPKWESKPPSEMRLYYKKKELEKQKHMEQIRLDAEKRYKESLTAEAEGTTQSGSVCICM